MKLSVSDIVGIPGVPSTNRGVRDWLKRNGVPLSEDGNRFIFELSDLPTEVRRAWVERDIEASGLALGMYDDEAHADLLAAHEGMRVEAERKAAVARFIVARRQAGVTWPLVQAAVWDRFGKAGNSAASLLRYAAQVEGVDPVNFAPALLAQYCGGAPKADITPEAWTLFEGSLKGAFKTHRVIAVYNDVVKIAGQKGWNWPSYSTVMRRFDALPMAEQIAIREGRGAAHGQLYQSRLRNSSGLKSMEWVVLDGRTVDVWVRMTDGAVMRPTLVGLVDQASGKVLGIEIDRSENAQAVARLERNVFAKYGAADNLLTDNGGAFSGHVHAGQVEHKHRNKGNRRRDLEPPGLHIHCGFNLHFALPKNAQAKLMERKFADMSREIDTCPEFQGAHAGSHSGEKPEGPIDPVPYDLFERVYLTKLAEYNARKGRRSQGCKASGTSSYDDAFKALGKDRMKRPLSEGQLRLATMEWALSTVLPDGRVNGKPGWVYGEDMDDGSQDKLMRFQGKKVWVATNPLDRREPAMVCDTLTGTIIAKAVHNVERGDFVSADQARRAAQGRAHVRKSTKRIAEIDEQAAKAELLAVYGTLPEDDVTPEDTVVKPHFKGAIRPERSLDDSAQRKVSSFITPEMQRNRDTAIGHKSGGR